MITLDLTDVLLVNGNAYDILNPTIVSEPSGSGSSNG